MASPFKSAQGAALYLASYDAMMQFWPTPYEEFDIPGSYGSTHIVANGPKDAPTLILLHGGRASLTMWSANVADLSRDYRVYAVDVMGQPSKSIPNASFQKRDDLIPWFWMLSTWIGPRWWGNPTGDGLPSISRSMYRRGSTRSCCSHRLPLFYR